MILQTEVSKEIQIVNASSEYEFFAGAAATAIGLLPIQYNIFQLQTLVMDTHLFLKLEQQPISIGGTPFVGIGTTATAIATATVTNGSISSITVGINSGIVGTGYTVLHLHKF